MFRSISSFCNDQLGLQKCFRPAKTSRGEKWWHPSIQIMQNKSKWLPITYLFSTVHGSDEMPLSTIIGGCIFIERTLRIFIRSFVDDFSESRATGHFGGIGGRNGFFNNFRIPVHSNCNCDRRWWCLERNQTHLFIVKIANWTFFVWVRNFANIVPPLPACIAFTC